MSKQGVRIRREIVGSSGENQVRLTAVVHIHLDHPAKRLRRLISDLDAGHTGHIAWWRGRKWIVDDADTVRAWNHFGHKKDKGAATEYFLQPYTK